MNVIREHLRRSVYGAQFVNDNVRIISGQEEAYFAWLAANYLKEKFTIRNDDQQQNNETTGILDIGGSSAQISIAPSSKKNASFIFF